jgi:hypothetical protein
MAYGRMGTDSVAHDRTKRHHDTNIVQGQCLSKPPVTPSATCYSMREGRQGQGLLIRLDDWSIRLVED